MTMQQQIHETGPLCHNLFLAIKPSPEAAARIGQIRDRVGSGEGRVRNGRLHVMTVMICPESAVLPPDLVAGICETMAALSAEAFDLTFDRYGPNGGALALFPHHGRKGLRMLRDQSELLLERAGLLPRKSRTFNPHMPLFYRPAALHSGRIAPIGWQAGEVVLIDSHVGLTRHVELARWPLIGQWRLL